MNNACSGGGSQWESNVSNVPTSHTLQIPESDKTDKTAKEWRNLYSGVRRKYRQPNPVRFVEDDAFIEVCPGVETVIDAADYSSLNGVRLSLKVGRGGKAYARCDFPGKRGPERYRALHRLLAGATGRVKIDHEDGDGLNNRQRNLRITDSTGNARNRRVNRRKQIQLKGVLEVPTGFRARISSGGRTQSLGVFPTAEGAARAYDAAALELHGEFACLNFQQLTRSVFRRQAVTPCVAGGAR